MKQLSSLPHSPMNLAVLVYPCFVSLLVYEYMVRFLRLKRSINLGRPILEWWARCNRTYRQFMKMIMVANIYQVLTDILHISTHLLITTVRVVGSIFPFYRLESWDTGKLINLPKIIELLGGRTAVIWSKIWTYNFKHYWLLMNKVSKILSLTFKDDFTW